MFNMLLLNSIRISYEDRQENRHGANVIGIAMWFYSIVLPTVWFTVFKAFEYFFFPLVGWVWMLLVLHLLCEQFSVIAMFRLRSFAAGSNGVPFYKNIGKNDDDMLTAVMYIMLSYSYLFVASTVYSEAPIIYFWPLLFTSTILVSHLMYHISTCKDKYYRFRNYSIGCCVDQKFHCDKDK